MALGAFIKAGAKAASPSIKRAFSKAVDTVRKADARLTDRVISRVAKTPPIVTQQGASIKAKVAATDAARAAARGTARKIVNTAYGVTGASATGAGVYGMSKIGSTSMRS